MATPLSNGAPEQHHAKHELREQIEFDKPACPMDCEACKSWACPGQRKLKNCDGTCGAIIAIGILGGGFTFTVIFSPIDDRHGTLSSEVIDRSRHFLVVAWVLFILAVSGASVMAYFFRLHSRLLVEQFDHLSPLRNILTVIYLTGLQLLIFAAFLMSARALKPYDEDTALAGIILIFIGMGYLILSACLSIRYSLLTAFGP